MMVWAPLAKSPNWPSQSTSASSRTTEYPYSKPIAAYSLRSESTTKNWLASEMSERRGVHSLPFSLSMMTAWRLENVPRRESCPAKRIGRPSFRREPKANISPVDQSIVASLIDSARFCSCGNNLGWTLNPSGIATCVAAISRMSCSEMKVGTSSALGTIGATKFGSCSSS